ncbi:uncharacterized protein LOC143283483 [Babylonia areolata]|uniref:uncharacterized protein LOC143283483 n=1 Tax=Babylonia areolata TaxID=304850 RepID=UPI003FCF8B3C
MTSTGSEQKVSEGPPRGVRIKDSTTSEGSVLSDAAPCPANFSRPVSAVSAHSSSGHHDDVTISAGSLRDVSQEQRSVGRPLSVSGEHDTSPALRSDVTRAAESGGQDVSPAPVTDSSNEIPTCTESVQSVDPRPVTDTGRPGAASQASSAPRVDDVMAAAPSLRDDVGRHPPMNVIRPECVAQDIFDDFNDVERDYLQGNTELTMDIERSQYVRTPKLEEAEEILKEKGWVVLCGPPGCGKTTLAHALLRRYREEAFKPYSLRQIGEWDSHVGENRRCAVLLDGTFGKIRIDHQQHDLWENMLDTTLALMAEGTCRLVITVYPHVLRQLQQLENSLDSPLLDGKGVVRFTDTLLESVKEKLLLYHLNELHIEPDKQQQIVKHVLESDVSGPVFPWCCRYMVKHWHSAEDPTAIFWTPANAHARLLKAMVMHTSHGSVFAAVLALTMRGVSHFLSHTSEAAPHLQEFGIGPFSDDKLAEYANVLQGSILSEGTFSSRVMYEAAGLALGRFFRLPILLKVCDTSFFVRYVHISVRNQTVSSLPFDKCVSVGSVATCSNDPKQCTEDRHSLMDRIYTEIIQGNHQYIIQHPCLQCPAFLQYMNDDYFAGNSKKMKQFLNAVDPVHKLPLVYWSILHPSHKLARWCLAKMQTDRKLSVHLLIACPLFDCLTQNSECTLQSFLRETFTARHFKHTECVLEFPLLEQDQCLRKEIEKHIETISDAENGSPQAKLMYLDDPLLPIPPEIVTVSMTNGKLQLQVKDKRHWYLVFRLLADRDVNETDQDGSFLLSLAVSSGEIAAVRLSLKAGAVITQQNRQGLSIYQLTQKARTAATKNKNAANIDRIFVCIPDLGRIEMQVFLLQEIDVNDKDSAGRTGLLVACREGRGDIADLFIQLGADVNIKDMVPCGDRVVETDDWCTPLHYACKNGLVSTVELLIQHKADVTATTKNGHTALHFACLCPSHIASAGAVLHLVQAGAAINARNELGETPLQLAAKKGHSDTAELLIRHGEDINRVDKKGRSPLVWTVANGHADTAELLIRHGADINKQDGDGKSPLHRTAWHGRSDIAELLLRYGADVSARDKQGRTPLMLLATMSGDADTAELLIHHGVDINAQNVRGESPLHIACCSSWLGHSATAELMIRHGADINLGDIKRRSTFMPTVTNAHRDTSETAELLIQHGADVNAQDGNGDSLLHGTARCGCCHIAELLLRHGADVNRQDKEGRSPLHCTAKSGRFYIAELLLRHGADVNAQDKRGRTPVMCVALLDKLNMTKLLVKHGAKTYLSGARVFLDIIGFAGAMNVSNSDVTVSAVDKQNVSPCPVNDSDSTPVIGFIRKYARRHTVKIIGSDVMTSTGSEQKVSEGPPRGVRIKDSTTSEGSVLSDAAPCPANFSRPVSAVSAHSSSGHHDDVTISAGSLRDVSQEQRSVGRPLSVSGEHDTSPALRSDVTRAAESGGQDIYPAPVTDSSNEIPTCTESVQSVDPRPVTDTGRPGAASQASSAPRVDDVMAAAPSLRDDVGRHPPMNVIRPECVAQDIQDQLFSVFDDFNDVERDYLQGNTELTMDIERSQYVRTPKLEEAEEILKEKGWVVLCGPPGCGKTTLAHALLRRYREEGFKPYSLRQIGEWDSHVGENRRCAVLLDGTFGKIRIDHQQHDLWENMLDTTLALMAEGTCRLVITVYPHVLRQLQQLENSLDSPLLDGESVVRFTDTLPESVREKLLLYHLNELHIEPDIQQQIVKHVLENDVSGPVFPWCCRYMVKHWHSAEDPTAVFWTPANAHARLLKAMVLHTSHGSAFAAVLALTMRGVSHFLSHTSEAAPHLREFGIGPFSDDKLAEYANVLQGSILSEGTFSSRVLYEAAGLALGRFFRLPILLKVCDTSFFVRYVHISAMNQTVSSLPHDICVSVGSAATCSNDPKQCMENRHSLMDRIYTEIIQGNHQYIIQHPCLQCPAFLQYMNDDYFAGNSKKMKQFLNAVDPVHKLPLVYWSILHPSHKLAQWCLTKMQTDRKLSVHLLIACPLFDCLTQNSECTLQSFLRETFTARHFKHTECVLEFPLLEQDQCLRKEIEKHIETITDSENGSHQARLLYLGDPILPIPPETVTVSMTNGKLQLQVKDKRHWYLVFRLLADQDVNETDQDGSFLLSLAVSSGETAAIRLSLKAGAVITQQNRQGLSIYKITQRVRSAVFKKKNAVNIDQLFRRIPDLGMIETQVFLLQEIGVNDKDSAGRTGLLVACREGRGDIADLYIQLGADVNIKDALSCRSGFVETDDWCTPLHYACKNGLVSTVELLIQHKADVTATTKNGHTALHFACLCSSHTASADAIRHLVQAGAAINARNELGETPLQLAAKKGHSDTAERLLHLGADVNVQDKEGCSPLMCTTGTGHADTAELLIRHHADVNAQADNGESPLHCAARYCYSDVAELLVRHGADVNRQDKEGRSPLTWTVMNGLTDTAGLLIRHGADVNRQSKQGRSLLFLTAMNGHTDIATLLLGHGADVNTQDKEECTPLLSAIRNGHAGTTELLIRHGADVNAQDDLGESPLHSTVLGIHLHIVELLVRHGANVNAQNRWGRTPLMRASLLGRSIIVKILENYGAETSPPRK